MSDEDDNALRGFCWCGCGERTEISNQTRNDRGDIKGQPRRYVRGHAGRPNLKHERKLRPTRKCPVCGHRYFPNYAAQQTCSPRCAGTRRRGRFGPQSPGWRGGVLSREGRTVVYVGHDHPMADSKGYAYEHRLVMAEHLGRMLASNELVHHRNEDPSDNRLENLQLMEWGAHTSHHLRANGYQPTAWGERNGNAKLTEKQVLAIRAEHSGQRGQGKALAAKYGISTAVISAIVTRRTWKHLP